MKTKEHTDRLSLQATDEEDFSVISAFLQDSLVRLRDMTYLKNEEQFIFVVERVVREGNLNDESGGRQEDRAQTGLCFEGVRSVHLRGMSQEERDRLLTFLTVAYLPGEIALIFTEGIVIRLRGDNMICLLRDLDKSIGVDGKIV